MRLSYVPCSPELFCHNFVVSIRSINFSSSSPISLQRRSMSLIQGFQFSSFSLDIFSDKFKRCETTKSLEIVDLPCHIFFIPKVLVHAISSPYTDFCNELQVHGKLTPCSGDRTNLRCEIFSPRLRINTLKSSMSSTQPKNDCYFGYEPLPSPFCLLQYLPILTLEFRKEQECFSGLPMER